MARAFSLLLATVAHAFVAPRRTAPLVAPRRAAKQPRRAAKQAPELSLLGAAALGVTAGNIAQLALPPMGSLAVGVANIAGYHVLMRKSEAEGAPSWRKSQGETRVEWARHVFETEEWTYAIQTLRNAITTNAFLASTVLTLSGLSIGALWKTVVATIGLGFWRTPEFWQLASAGGCLLLSAYSFSQSARLMVHAGFMFPVAARGGAVSRAAVEAVMVRSHVLQWGGWRWLYLGAWVATWVLGGEYVACASSFALTFLLMTEDRKPPEAVGL